MALTAAERQRRCREKRKANEVKEEEYKRKARERYHAKKRLTKDMSSREKRAVNRKWREQKRNQRQARRNQQTASPESTSPTQSERSLAGRRKVRRDRSSLYRKYLKMQQESNDWRRKYEKMKKRLQRLSKADQATKYRILSTAVKDRYFKEKTRSERRKIKDMILRTDDNQSGQLKSFTAELLGIKRFRETCPKTKDFKLRQKIRNFYLRDDISRITAGKKETVTRDKVKVQRRYLLDSMKNLHRQFIQEEQVHCSYVYFSRHRPFFVLLPRVDERDTCVCKKHANMKYKALALKKSGVLHTDDLSQIITSIVCDVESKVCMYNTCHKCKDNKCDYDNILFKDGAQQISWEEWKLKEEIYVKKNRKIITKKYRKEKCEGLLSDLLVRFEKDVILFKKHIFNIKSQYRSFRHCLANLKCNEVALIVDFSENYLCKYGSEIQAHHYGGSRNQIALHTGVVYYTLEGAAKNKTISFSTLSSCTAHNPPAIWAHLDPVLKLIRKEIPHAKTVHFFSDGPCTQYRQKHNFYLLSHRFYDYGFAAATWSFFEAGHGKGPADGVGGTLKRLADKQVAFGNDLADVNQFYEQMVNKTDVQLFVVNEKAIEDIGKSIPQNVQPMVGTMSVHQVLTDKSGLLHYRDTSCFCHSGAEFQFCYCKDSRTYIPITNEDREIENLTKKKGGSFYRAVYSPSISGSDTEDEPLSTYVRKARAIPASTSGVCQNKVTDSRILHRNNISAGTFVLVKMKSDKSEYRYVGVCQNRVDEEGEVKIMFMRVGDESCKTFKMDEDDVSYVQYEDIICILGSPTIKMKGVRLFYTFPGKIDVLEK